MPGFAVLPNPHRREADPGGSPRPDRGGSGGADLKRRRRGRHRDRGDTPEASFERLGIEELEVLRELEPGFRYAVCPVKMGAPPSCPA
jgi:hypothetical protein